ncbi:antibiotic biosynthesis monooxygenase family protein [Deefgea piscis]|uniref:antibiotic biosynthesis monooxygenase family protein n=1 Tax=Deefgea piscis TaxID=2739061 RepID=UPI001C8219E1|nr:hypothetical protein [Deefgea piscis]QZA79962.1 hypothetical protein K4H25_10435 [Deefgea piscis]
MTTENQHPSYANTPKPPYYAVIFTSIRTEDEQGYAEMAEKMLALAQDQPGFLGSVDVWFADRVCADFGLKQGERRVA